MSDDYDMENTNSDFIVTRRRSTMLAHFQPMMPSPFDVLSDEMILEITTYLDQASLKSLLEVSRTFNRIITQSRQTMKILPMTIRPFRASKNREIMDFNRVYRRMDFIAMPHNKWFKYVKENLRRIGQEVEKVTFTDCQFLKFSEVLSCFPNIKTLKVLGTFSDLESRPINPANFPKLERVKIDSSLLKSFISMQLTSLKIHNLKNQEWGDLVKFLASQKELRDLQIIDGCNLPAGLTLEPLQLAKPMNSLRVLAPKNFDTVKFIEFLMLFETGLNRLSITGFNVHPGTHSIYDAVLCNLKHLDTLSIDTDHLNGLAEFFRTLEVNHNLKTLVLSGNTLNNPVGIHGILKHYPSITSLTIRVSSIGHQMQPTDLDIILTLKKLQNFKLVIPYSDRLHQGFFKGITNLHITYLSSPVDWFKLAKDSPNLTSVTICTVVGITNFNLQTLVSSLKKLETFNLGSGFSITKSRLKIIQKHAKNLQTLTVLNSWWNLRETPGEVISSMALGGLKINLNSSGMEI